jgi:hypothetical protein
MARFGTSVLQDNELLPHDDEPLEELNVREYVLTAAMLGLIKTGHPNQAQALWMTYGEEQFTDITLTRYAQLVLELSKKGFNSGSDPALLSSGS